MIASLACRSYTASALSSPTRTLAGSRGADRGGTAAYPAAPAPEHSRGLRTAGHRRRRCRRLRPWRYRKPAAQPGSRAPLHIAAATHLMHNGPLTVIKQSRGHGGVYPVGRTGLGSMLLRCRGAFSACMELEYIAWSPDGARIALGVTSYATPSRYDGLHVVDLASGRDTQLTKDRELERSGLVAGRTVDRLRRKHPRRGRARQRRRITASPTADRLPRRGSIPDLVAGRHTHRVRGHPSQRLWTVGSPGQDVRGLRRGSGRHAPAAARSPRRLTSVVTARNQPRSPTRAAAASSWLHRAVRMPRRPWVVAGVFTSASRASLSGHRTGGRSQSP